MVSPPSDSLLETMTHAADALQCRVAAGRSQLTSTMLTSDVKQSIIDDAIARMTGVPPAAEFMVRFALCTSVTLLYYMANAQMVNHLWVNHNSM